MGSIRRAVMGAGLLLATVLASAGEPAAATPEMLKTMSACSASKAHRIALPPNHSNIAHLVFDSVNGIQIHTRARDPVGG